MAAERKDVRFKLDEDTHTQLKAICDLDGRDLGEFVESLVVPVVAKRVHDAMLLVDRLQRQGVAGNFGECPGTGGSRDK